VNNGAPTCQPMAAAFAMAVSAGDPAGTPAGMWGSEPVEVLKALSRRTLKGSLGGLIA